MAIVMLLSAWGAARRPVSSKNTFAAPPAARPALPGAPGGARLFPSFQWHIPSNPRRFCKNFPTVALPPATFPRFRCQSEGRHTSEFAGTKASRCPIRYRICTAGLPKRLLHRTLSIEYGLTPPRRHSCSIPVRRDRPHCSLPTPCWASRSPPPSPPGRGSISQKSPGTAGIPS